MDYSYSVDMIPFDAYSLTVFAFVIEKATNSSTPVVAFIAPDAPDNFVISSTEEMAMNNYTYDSGTGPTVTEVQSSVVFIEVARSQFARAFTMCLLLINWAFTIGSIYVVLVVAIRDGGKNDTVLLLPVTIILTIPALRELYIGSPPFGIFIGKSRALRSQFEY